jgi:uncharacterized protein (TIGR00251 family)
VALPEWVTSSKDGTLVDVFAQPRAAKDALAGVHGAALKAKVSAPPVDDRANQALERFLAGLLCIPVSRVSVVGGRASRHKKVAIAGLSPDEVARALQAPN